MQRIILTILVLVAALGGGYVWFSQQSSEPTETPFTQEVQKKLDQYRKIHELSPNLSIFDDRLFQILQRIQAPQSAFATSTVQRGRENPFVPF